MKRVETAIAKRLELATKPMKGTQPTTIKELKLLKRRFGVTFFVDISDALAFAKGKGFKVVNHTEGPSSYEPAASDFDFFYEITDKSGRSVGFASGDAKMGEAYIAPTAQHYNRWMKYAQDEDMKAQDMYENDRSYGNSRNR